MKPLSLTMTAFGPFQTKTEIDFSKFGNSLFLITGKTGSGKTTIFDAMMYALFGESSGGERKAKELRTHFISPKTKTEVELVFLHNDNFYKIRRSISSAKKSDDVSLWSSENELVEGAKQVNSYVKNLLGVSATQFRGIAMIAQGKFRELIKANTNERATILRTLFNTQIYSQFQESIKRKADMISGEFDMIQDRLSQKINQVKCPVSDSKYQWLLDYVSDPDISESNLKSLLDSMDVLDADDIVRIQNLNAEISQQEIQRTLIIEKLTTAEENNKKIDAVNATQKKLDELMKEQTFYQGLEKRIILAKKAETVSVIESEYERQTEERKGHDNTLSKNQEYIKQNAETLSQLNDVISTLENNPEIETFKKSIGKIELELPQYLEIKTKLSLKKTADDNLKASNEKLSELDTKIQEIHESINKDKEHLIELKERISVLEDVPDIEDDKKKSLYLEQELPKYEELNGYRKQKTELDKELKKISTDIKGLDDEITSSRDSLFVMEKRIEEIGNIELSISDSNKNKASCDTNLGLLKELSQSITNLKYLSESKAQNQAEYRAAKEKCRICKIAYDTLNQDYLDNQAGILAEKLKDGEPCPVCGSLTHPSPAVSSMRAPDKEEVSKAREAYEAAQNLQGEMSSVAQISCTKYNLEEEQFKKIADVYEKQTGDTIAYSDDFKLVEQEITQKSSETRKKLSDIEVELKKLEALSEEKKELEQTIPSLKKALEGANDRKRDTEKTQYEKQTELKTVICNIEGLQNSLSYSSLEEARENYDRLNAAIKKHDDDLKTAKEERDAVDNMIGMNTNLLDETVKNKEMVETEHKPISSEVDRLAAAIESLRKNVSYGSENEAKSAIEEYQSKIKQHNESLESKRGERNILSENISKAKGVVEDTKPKLDAAIKSENEKKLLFESTLKENGFESVDVYHTAKEDIEHIDEYGQMLQTYTTNLKEVQATLNAQIKLTKDKEYTNLDSLNASKKASEDALTELREIQSGCIHRQKDNLQTKQSIIDTFGRYQILSQESDNLRKLSDAATGHISGQNNLEFEKYILAVYFEEVLNFTNTRLDDMTNGRYTLQRTDLGTTANAKTGLDILVLDNFTGKTRTPNTLSGGESFQAALALALGLSDMIQCMAGGIQIDAMFVDEGFDSLDSETLQDMIKVLENLTIGCRVVGIISHVDGLNERLERKIVVNKLGNGRSEVVIKC